MTFRRPVWTFLAVLAISTPAAAESRIEILHPWARPSLPDRPGVAYMGIHNPGNAPDRLVGARAARAGSIEIHQAAQTGGVMSMVPVDSVEIPAEGMAHLGPGGLHLMLFGLAPPLKEGESFPIVLIFESAGEIPIEVPVMKMMGHDLQQDHGGGHQHGTTEN